MMTTSRIGSTRTNWPIATSLLMAWMLALCGCHKSPPQAEPKANPASPTTEEAKPPAKGVETWAKITLDGNHAGYRRLWIVPDAKPDVLRYEMEQVLRVKRGKDVIEQKLAETSLETAEGEWLGGSAAYSDGGVQRTDTIAIAKGLLTLTQENTGAAVSRKALSWKTGYVGFFGVESSLRRTPLKPGERREFQTLFPLFNEIGGIVVTAKDFGEIDVGGVKQRALEVEQEEFLKSTSTKTTLWLDEKGEMLVAEIASLKMRVERSSKAAAEEISNAQDYDLLAATLVPVQTPLADFRTNPRRTYRVRLKQNDPSKIFPAREYQLVKAIDGQTAEIAVIKSLELAKSGQAGALPEAADSAPNAVINSDSPAIKQLAASVASEEADSLAVALALEKFAYSYIERKDFAAAFDPASEVVKTKQGDCTEHAVFLAALCRARGIPARCASGLVYVPSKQAFGFHLWTLAYVSGRWTPLDATLGLGGTTSGHLLLAESNLASGPDAGLFLPVMSVLGQLEIEVIEK